MRMLGTCVLALLLWSAAAGAACPPAGHDAAALGALKARRFAVADAGERQRLAVALLDCLGDPDPALRDGLAYEALSAWMRGGHLSDSTLAGLLDRLLPMLAADGPAGYRSTAYVLANEQDDVPTRERQLPGLRAALRRIP